ncbi:class I tRNA ligase family protein [Aquimarina sp. RZ0]|uniref:class I tRNA ligase family protein n=1 Tax=Aquimarina sp. RZ0 TaxID=2607730 RepID=UPI0011F25B50|nr:class I tRNA ligase family protein [Aquimarina sp. RZ0]KAA1243806.1 class I tRNA ligase family protein [Aquimarina sp. RZ0]
MKIHNRKFDKNHFSEAYGIQCGEVLPADIKSKIPTGFTWCIVPKNSSSTLHKHFEFEMFIVYRGKGKIRSGSDTLLIEELDCIYLDEFQEHEIINTGDQDMVILSVWGRTLKKTLKQKSKDQIVITSTPPTPNGDLHLGHLSGPYLAADIYRRIALMQGFDVVHYTGTDTYQNYVLKKALETDNTPLEVANYYSGEIKKTLETYHIHTDLFQEPKKVRNYELYLKEVFLYLYKEGHIIEKEVDTTYSGQNNTYLFESLISGKCPHCQSGCSGNLCENCGMHNDCAEIIDKQSTIDTAPVFTKKTKRFYFSFQKVMPQLLTYFKQVQDDNIKQFIEQVLENNLQDYPISHESDWGISVPIEKCEQQVISSWFEMGVGHLVSLLDQDKELKNSVDAVTRLKEAYQGKCFVQMFGFDNSIFNVFLFPGIFTGLGLPIAKGLKMNKFLLLEGQKFSTSRGHAIWGKEIAQKVNVDILRYYLSWINPADYENNFTKRHFNEFINTAIDQTIKKHILAVDKTLEKFKYKTPVTTRWTDAQEAYYKKIEKEVNKYLPYYNLEQLSLHKIAVYIFEFTTIMNEFRSKAILFEADTHQDFLQTQVALELMSLRTLSLLSYPIMPGFSEALWNKLCPEEGIEDNGFNDLIAFIPSNINLQNLSSCLNFITYQLEDETVLS